MEGLAGKEFSMPFKENESILLVGLPGSGKSCVGNLVAERLGWAFADTDGIIETRTEKAIADLVATDGWAYFRSHERQVLAEQLQRKRIVIATGGGIVESTENRTVMNAAGLVFWLRAPLELLLERLVRDATVRPLLSDSAAERLAELADRREPLYAAAADYRIDTGELDEIAVADMIATIAHQQQEQTR